jgi:hypothetical protein
MGRVTGYGYTTEISFAARFVDGMREVAAKASERKPLAIKVPCADVYLLLQLAKAAGSVERRFVAVDLASGPDRTVITKVEIVDGAANVIESKVLEPSLAEGLGPAARGTK